MTLRFTVHGTPAPQGSKKNVGRRGGPSILIESSANLKPWREAVKYAALDALGEATATLVEQLRHGPIAVSVTFRFARPKSVRREWPTVRPDIDKLCRAILDALGDAGVYRNDAQVVVLSTMKTYTTKTPCAVLEVGVVGSVPMRKAA